MPNIVEQEQERKTSGIGDESTGKTALLISRDSASQKWGPRWLEQSGFLTATVQEPALAAEIAQELQPAVIIIDASLRDAEGRCLYETVRNCGTREPLPTIVLCANPSEVQSALDFGHVTELARKPYDWNLISRRAAQAANLYCRNSELIKIRRELESARANAEVARRDLERGVEHDALTGLAARPKFRKLLDRLLDGTDSQGQTELSLLIIRLNRFRLVNETLGHSNGNRVLVQIGERLRNCLGNRKAATGLQAAGVARLGGIRFGLLVNGLCDPADVRLLANKVLDELCQPVQINGQSIYLSASIGGAIAPADGEDADRLMQHAELALREAKQRGGGFRLFREPSAAGSARELQLDGWLHEALDREQLYLEYQPMLDVAENRVVGAEALLRWHHPVKGMISPAEFVPIAENSGLMTRIGALVIDRACRQLREWLDAGADNLRMCINLSLYQLRHDDVVAVVERALHTSQLDPRLVELELSERGVVGRDGDVLRQLHRLKSLGVRLAIDDFGTGESAIAYLKELPIDVLKIDRSYINGVLNDARDAAIVAGLIALARRLDLTVVAEGVEAAVQIELLRTWGCHQYQGFYFSPAVAGNRFLSLAEPTRQRMPSVEPGLADLY